MSALETLGRHAKEFREATSLTVEIIEEPGGSRIFVLIRQVPLPPGLFRVENSDTLFIADRQYPDSAIDMFWTEVPVVRPNGAVPQGASQIEHYLNREWRRFSWHRNGKWNPSGNGLLDHFAFMESAWTAEAKQ
jgi:hypothetical protein